MRLSLSPVNGSEEKVRLFLRQALPNIEVLFTGQSKSGFDAFGVLEVSEFDPYPPLPGILRRAGINIAQAIGGNARVLCQVDRSPDIQWQNNPTGDW